ncbi:hypothetical protein PybrP1_011957 [[Pythium] brassicae (nom. inval.)]|nr:hypothetical protein PybrP1_011957 [[Pythium] brassicae (nom. inval.)]
MRSPERAESAASMALPQPSSPALSTANEVKHLAERLNAAQIKIKVKRLGRLEAALVDFFMEVMERGSTAGAIGDSSQQSGPGGAADQHFDSAFARQKRKEQFLRKADGDPISLLNALRTHLRIQFATQCEQHQQLSSSLSAAAARKDAQEHSSRHELQRLEAANDDLRGQISTLVRQVTVGESERRRLDRQYKRCLEQLSGELLTLRTQDEASVQRVQQQQLEVESLKQTCAELVKEKRKLLDDLQSASAVNPSGGAQGSLSLAATAHVESSRSITSTTTTLMTPADAEKLRRALREYENKVTRLEGANEEWRAEAQRLQQHIVGLRLNKQVQAFEKLSKDGKKTKAQAEESKRRLTETEAELLRIKAALKERDARVQHMKDEYNKLFTALQKIKTPSATQLTSASVSGAVSGGHSPPKLTRLATLGKLLKAMPMTDGPGTAGASVGVAGAAAASTAAQANDHPYLLEHYKEHIEVLGKEIEGLRVQIRKMIASEYRYKQKNRLFRTEKAQLVDAHDRLRGELDKRVLSSAKRIVDGAHEYLAAGSRHGSGEDCDVSMSSRVPSTSSAAVNEVKKLRQRNQFLEERFRAINASSQLGRRSSVTTIKSDVATSSGVSEAPPATRRADSEAHLRSLDPKTLQALQQVRSKARVNPEQHERVAKALEQINGLRYRYYSSPKDAKQVLSFDSDSEGSDSGEGERGGRRKSTPADDDISDELAGLSFDDHIDRILRKTRTIALLKIANNTAEVLSENDSFLYDSDAEFGDEDDAFDDDDDSFETVDDQFAGCAVGDVAKPLSPLQAAATRSSFRRNGSMRSSASNLSSGSHSSSSHRVCHEESVAANRLITEKLLDEPSDGHEDYGDLIDFHVDSARESASAGGDTGADELPLWKRRHSNTVAPLKLSDDPSDLELHQRRMFMEANRFSRFSSRNFLAGSSKSLVSKGSSGRPLGSPSSSLGSQSGSFRAASDAPLDALTKKESRLGAIARGSSHSLAGSVVEQAQEEEQDATAGGDTEQLQGESFNEDEYRKWRTEVKAEYLAWINAKLETKRKRRETLKKDAGKKPRWLLLFEASKRPEPKEAKKQ